MTRHAELAWTEEGQPFSVNFDDIYCAQEGGVAECESTFIQHNQLHARWLAHSLFTIGETGFGTGTNFLTTCHHFLASTTQTRLRFVSVEKFPLRLDDLKRSHNLLPVHLHGLAEQLQQQYPPALSGLHRIYIDSRIELWLMLGDAQACFADLPNTLAVDAWFLDGFAPAKNKDMWSDGVFRQLSRLSKPQEATLVTFTAASAVRKGLMAAGFEMHKVPGFGRKREMLVGRHQQYEASRRAKPKRWLPLPERYLSKGCHVVVIGAGIAGASVAAQLARSGLHVTVLEATSQPATAASGNLAGSCLPVVDRQHGIYAHWYWQAWQSARRWLEQQRPDLGLGDLSGAFKWINDGDRAIEWQDWLQQLDAPAWMTWWTEMQAQQAILPDVQAGIWLSRAGWLAPKKVVAQLLSDQNIVLRTNCAVNALRQLDEGWQLTLHDTSVLEADAVVIATGANTGELLPDWRPHLHFQKGQVSHIKVDDWREAPSLPLTFGGYVMPPVDGLVCVGATFEQKAPLELTTLAHEHNMRVLREALPNALKANAQPVGGHSAYRMMTVDHLPLVGPVVNTADYSRRLQGCPLRPDTCPDVQESLISGLWMSAGHGSRGLTSAFLAAEVLAAQMLGQLAPVTTSTLQAVHPARVVFRQLARQLR